MKLESFVNVQQNAFPATLKPQTMPESNLFLLRGGASTVPLRGVGVDAGVLGVTISSAIWLCLFLELQGYKKAPSTTKAISELRDHRSSKWKCLRSTLLPLLLVFMVGCGKEHSFLGKLMVFGSTVPVPALFLSTCRFGLLRSSLIVPWMSAT